MLCALPPLAQLSLPPLRQQLLRPQPCAAAGPAAPPPAQDPVPELLHKVFSEKAKLDKEKGEKKHVRNNKAKHKRNAEEYAKGFQKNLAMSVATSWRSSCSSPSGTASPSRATGAEAAASASRAKAGGARARGRASALRCAAMRSGARGAARGARVDFTAARRTA